MLVLVLVLVLVTVVVVVIVIVIVIVLVLVIVIVIVIAIVIVIVIVIGGSLRGILTSSWCEAREEVGPDATQKRQFRGQNRPKRPAFQDQ